MSSAQQESVVAEIEEDRGGLEGSGGHLIPIYTPIRFIRVNDAVVELQFKYIELVDGEHIDEWRGLKRLNRESPDAKRLERQFGISLSA